MIVTVAVYSTGSNPIQSWQTLFVVFVSHMTAICQQHCMVYIRDNAVNVFRTASTCTWSYAALTGRPLIQTMIMIPISICKALYALETFFIVQLICTSMYFFLRLFLVVNTFRQYVNIKRDIYFSEWGIFSDLSQRQCTHSALSFHNKSPAHIIFYRPVVSISVLFICGAPVKACRV